MEAVHRDSKEAQTYAQECLNKQVDEVAGGASHRSSVEISSCKTSESDLFPDNEHGHRQPVKGVGSSSVYYSTKKIDKEQVIEDLENTTVKRHGECLSQDIVTETR